MNSKQGIEESAKEYARNNGAENPFTGNVNKPEFEMCKRQFLNIVTSNAAKEYWFEQFKDELEHICVGFVKWHDNLSFQEKFNIESQTGLPYPTYNDAFNLFITTVYGK